MQQQPQQQQLDESPFSRWRKLRNDPRFIEAVTAFCDDESHARFDVAMEYAVWWAPHVRRFRFELLVILERDIAVEMLIERTGRSHILDDEDEEFYALERYWERKQLLAFWPRWVEHAHGVLASRIWTQQSCEWLELHSRFASVSHREVKEREALYRAILDKVAEVPLEWADFVPPLVQEQRESVRRHRAAVAAEQEKDVEALRQLLRHQSEAMAKQREEEFHRAREAGYQRIVWGEEQARRDVLERAFPSRVGGSEYDDDATFDSRYDDDGDDWLS
jgi:hypothetical protein